MHTKLLGLLATITLCASCANPEVVQPTQPGDQKLSCTELEDEIEKASEFEDDARDERGTTGKNIAAAVLFWPALGATYANTEEAIDAAQDRQEHLTEIYEEKNC